MKNKMKPLLELKTGTRLTMIRNHSRAVHITITSAQIQSYAQYPETLVLYYKEKRGRSLKGIRFLPTDSYLIYQGFVSVATEPLYKQKTIGDFIITSFVPNDPRYLYRVKDSTQESPFLESLPALEEIDGDQDSEQSNIVAITPTIIGKKV